ncbi:PhzF family phenazine biosynthesis protein [Aestuariivirga sp.]|jgi:trans-2,3-dihydro-3-hydroxyanthranilate isomerase|uniref:PhzF family phenazine biosynthesis protein n=1 Tax=Aestuariivirga sp. TaxID=2650926 RepID=UPI003784B4B6
MKLAFHTYDVFTNSRFCGNPLAIVEEADALTASQMQEIAREFNLSETIFVCKPKNSANAASVRIFLPTAEIPFAGHPTVGCAVHLAQKKYKPGCSFETSLTLEAVAGLVPVKVTRIGDVPRAQFTAPVRPFAVDVALPTPEDVARGLGIDASDIGFGSHVMRVLEGGPRFLYVPLGSREALARARPCEPVWTDNFRGLGTVMAYIYAHGGENPDTAFRARALAPGEGIPEDPATGSATAILAAQLLEAEGLQDGTHRWRLEQGYEMGRPSDLWLEADVASSKLAAVRVAGQAVQIMSGVLEV